MVLSGYHYEQLILIICPLSQTTTERFRIFGIFRVKCLSEYHFTKAKCSRAGCDVGAASCLLVTFHRRELQLRTLGEIVAIFVCTALCPSHS